MPIPKKILVANRGTAATRIIRCCKKLGIPFVTIYTLEDADSLHVDSSSVCLHDSSSKALDTYLNMETIFKICKDTGCDAIHPGYGFLSENAEFAQGCEDRGITFIGPTPEQISSFGLKHSARALAEKFQVPLLPGSGLLRDVDHAKLEATRIGYPVLLKCVAGGGGIGLKICDTESALIEGFDSVKRLAKSAFKDDGVFLEKFLPKARHVEVQIFGDGKGNVVALGERDCSTQRRNQKVLEESPAPYLTDDIRKSLWESAVRLAKGVGYRSAGTIEYIVDAITLDFYFLEVNTRVQVEHGVTEQVYSTDEYELDIIDWMIKTSGGELDLSTFTPLTPKYHSIQCRIYAEDANKNYQPSSGILTQVLFPAPTKDVRVETWVKNGVKVSSLYDPMLGKLICRGKDRSEAISRLLKALRETHLDGLESNLEFLEQIVNSEPFGRFKDGLVFTHWLTKFNYTPCTIDVLEPGTQTSIQDYPGRIGYWAPGVPPCGPMDHLAFRLANILVGNLEGNAGLEMTIQGACLKFNCSCYIAITGAQMEGDLNGQPVKFWKALKIEKGSVLTFTKPSQVGCRTYLAVSGGGFQVPDYLGSKSTFALGKFGGHAGRTLMHGDVLHLSKDVDMTKLNAEQHIPHPPSYSNDWELHVTMGPHSAPDFFTSDFIDSTFFKTKWSVHYNSNRLGIRLSGPKPSFTRLDGGEAGLHPSNIHDTVYAIGTVNFTGDMPVILGLDGPSLGGFVCPCTIVKADLWKIGQLRPGDAIKFVLIDFENALAEEKKLDSWLSSGSCFSSALETKFNPCSSYSAILREFLNGDLKVVYRLAGDKNILIEYGELILDLKYRFRVHALMKYLNENPITGVIELSPGVRSLQVQFDSRKIPSLKDMLDLLQNAESQLIPVETMQIPSRVIHLPLAFEASSTQQAINKYRQSVRDTAPWLPSNVEFIRRINGLSSVEEVKSIVFQSNFLVLGLGDVYLGAPCAVPVDPRHRLLTTKYNPARTWTEEGEVGIGGVFMCIYGMQSPGGYQLIGRTIPIWNNFPKSGINNWLLASFDQVKFHLVSEEALMQCRKRYTRGEDCSDMIKISHEVFHVQEYLDFLKTNTENISQFQQNQRQAFEMERDRWTTEDDYVVKEDSADTKGKNEEITLPDDVLPVRSQIAGNIWSVSVNPGDYVEKGQVVIIVEAMKLEIAVNAPFSGTISQVFVKPGSKCNLGDLLLTFETLPSEVEEDLTLDFTHIRGLLKKYKLPTIISGVLHKIKSASPSPVWISLRPEADIFGEIKTLDPSLPLYGLPFAAKDNIDVKGMLTTCACPDYAYTASESATCIQVLQAAGAILIGKTNMDQFAAGLVGVRSPYGVCSSVFNPAYVSGGSSSGSAVAVASNQVCFSLGTDTAGSGRVPAMMNNLIGLKPTKGLISTKGVVPACKSLDCISIFAHQVNDAKEVFQVMNRFDENDEYARISRLPSSCTWSSSFRFGVPTKLEFFEDKECEKLFQLAVLKLKGMGGIPIEIDFGPFQKTANLLYQGPWVAERLEALQPFFCEENKSKIHPTTYEIISKGSKYSAVDCFKSYHELEQLKRISLKELEKVDVLLVPTAPRTYKIEDVEANPIQLNSNLGIYTNFVNLLDLSALAVPCGFCETNDMPFGVTFISRPLMDLSLCEIAERFINAKTIDLAVCGAHLTGMPLNSQLTDRNAVFVKEAKTARGKYRLYALSELKPGLVRTQDAPETSTIAVEIWRFPNVAAFGDFVNIVPQPLVIGMLEIEGQKHHVKSFLCEEYAVKQPGVTDITSFGGWKAFKMDVNKV